jgi:hypothetical protein
MNMKIESRLRAAERKTKRKRNNVLHVVRMEGGLPGWIRCASANGLHWERLCEESMEEFEARVIAAANADGVKNVVIGGLCDCHWKEPGNFEAYLNGPDFPEVPPEETA